MVEEKDLKVAWNDLIEPQQHKIPDGYRSVEEIFQETNCRRSLRWLRKRLYELEQEGKISTIISQTNKKYYKISNKN